MDTLFLEEYRCKCGKLLLKGLFFGGTLEIKCSRCGDINKLGTLKLADNTISYVLIINDRGKITNLSDSACHILGYTADELIGTSFSKINPTMTSGMDKKLLSVLNKKNRFRLDTVHQSKAGNKISVSIIMRLHQSVNKNRYLLIFATIKKPTITKTYPDKDTVDFLKEGCDYYFDIDKNGISEYMSLSVEKIFGFTPDKIIGKNYFDFLPASTKSANKKSFSYYSAKEQPFRIVHQTGLDKKSQATGSEQYFTPKFNENGEFIGYRVMGWIVNAKS